jgi:thymidine phosphorylase
VQAVLDTRKGPHGRVEGRVRAREAGWVKGIDAYAVGLAAVTIGAGRSRKGDVVLPGVGITFLKVQGGEVRAGEDVALVQGEDASRVEEAAALVERAFTFSPEPVPAGGDRVREEITGE